MLLPYHYQMGAPSNRNRTAGNQKAREDECISYQTLMKRNRTVRIEELQEIALNTMHSLTLLWTMPLSELLSDGYGRTNENNTMIEKHGTPMRFQSNVRMKRIRRTVRIEKLKEITLSTMHSFTFLWTMPSS